MKVPAGYRVGAATHTGLVRAANEDDYFLGGLPGAAGGDLLLAGLADGMGGTAGGAEASRMALFALAAAVLDGGAAAAPAARLRAGFAAAQQRVAGHAAAVPALRDMGTTLTALCLLPGRALVGHVGDTRLLRRRGGRWTALTVDHAVREPDNLLTRCIGGGVPASEVDFAELDAAPGDRFLLLSDGIWGVVPAAALAALADRPEPQEAAEALVAAALAAGGPDNATAVAVDVGAAAAVPAASVDLPADERAHGRERWPRPPSLRAPLWPWLLLGAAGAAALLAALRLWFGVDGLHWLRQLPFG